MKLYLTKADDHHLIVDGINRFVIWFDKPCLRVGEECIFANSRYDDFMYTEWQGDNSIKVRAFAKTLSKEHKDKFIRYVVKQIRSTYKWEELEWHDWLMKVSEEVDKAKGEWFASHNASDFEHYGYFQEACKFAIDEAICKDKENMWKEWCHEFNLFEVLR